MDQFFNSSSAPLVCRKPCRFHNLPHRACEGINLPHNIIGAKVPKTENKKKNNTGIDTTGRRCAKRNISSDMSNVPLISSTISGRDRETAISVGTRCRRRYGPRFLLIFGSGDSS